MDELPEMLRYSQQVTQKYLYDRMLESVDPPAQRPYKWRVAGTGTVQTYEYRGQIIEEQRTFWTPPEKELPEGERHGWPFYHFAKPLGLDEKNSYIRFTTQDFDSKWHKSHLTLEDAKAYIDTELALSKRAESLASVIDFLKRMPCSCGEYGDVSDREYLRFAAELTDLIAKR
jgi:hypothetical protein